MNQHDGAEVKGSMELAPSAGVTGRPSVSTLWTAEIPEIQGKNML